MYTDHTTWRRTQTPPSTLAAVTAPLLRTRQKPTDNSISLPSIRALRGPVLQPTIRPIRSQSTHHIRREMYRHTLVRSGVVVVQGTGLHAVVKRIGYDAQDLEPAVVGSTDWREMPRPGGDGDGLMPCVVEGGTGEGEGAGCGCLVWDGRGG
jgi:hypothetical protein